MFKRVGRVGFLGFALLVVLALVAGCGGVEPAPTLTPVPTIEPTVSVVETPEASSTPEELAEKAWDTAVMLAEELSPRESATEEELRAAEWLAGRFSGWGYEVGLEEFEAIELSQAMRLVVVGPEDVVLALSRFGFRDDDGVWFFGLPVDPSSLAAEGYRVQGDLVYAGWGTVEELAGVDLSGRIALMEGGGEVSLPAKIKGAAQAGALAAVIFNEEPNSGASWGRVYEDTEIPAIAIGNREGRGLALALESGGGVEVRVSKGPLSPQPSRNVIAELENDIEDDEVLVVGAHYDTTPDTQGANDNGSGVAVILTLAEELAGDELPFDLRFVLFGAEETGLNGSFAYVGGLEEDELDRIMAMINLDVVGTGVLTAIGSDSMVEYAVEVGSGIGIEVLSFELPPGYGSDHVAFISAGVDAVFLFADDVTYINSPRDTLEHLQFEPLSQATELTLEMIERLAEE